MIGTYLIWEYILVVQEVLGPVHQRVNVFRSWKFGRFLVLDTVFPQVFIPSDWLEMDTGYSVVSHRGPADMIGH